MATLSAPSTPTAAQRRPRRALAALLTGAAFVVASVVVGVFATPGRIIALPGSTESTVVTVEPTRILDTRVDVGLTGLLTAKVSRKLQITGTIETYVDATATRTDKIVVPTGATGVMMNITAVLPTGTGYLSVRPGNATGVPATAGLNFDPGDIIPNALTVALPTTGAHNGKIDLYYGTATAGAQVDVVIDIVGYTTNAGLTDLVNRVLALETAGVQGDTGPPGPQGDPGPRGDPGTPAVAPARVVWVSESGGDYTSVSGALDAIGTDLPAATADDPYVINVGPGHYIETAPIVLEDFVDIEGSGRGVTTITCATCSGPAGPEAATLAATGPITSEVRDLSVENTGGDDFSIGVWSDLATDSLTFTRVGTTATGGTFGLGVFNLASSPNLVDVSASAHDNTESYGVFNNDGSHPMMTNVTVAARNSAEGYGVLNLDSSPTMRTLNVRVEDNGVNFGVSNENATAPLLSTATIVVSGTECYGVRNEASNPEIENVGIFLQCSGELQGVDNLNASAARLHNVEITAQPPPGFEYAVFAGITNDGSSPTIDSVIITSGIGEENFGVRNIASTPMISNLIADIEGGTISNIGVSNEAATAATIHTSSLLTRLFGALAIVNDATSTALVTDSTLEGTVIEGGLTCIGVHTPTGLELGRDCVSLAGPSPANVVWVAETGGDFTSVRAALMSISNNSATNPYVVRIAPGVYVETGQIDLKDYVDVEGSGEDVTTVTCACVAPWAATVVAEGLVHSEIRHLTIANTGIGTSSVALHAHDGGGLSLLHLTATATGGTTVNFAIKNDESSPTMSHVTATATGSSSQNTAIINTSSSPRMIDVTATASGGTQSNWGVRNVSSSPSMTGITAHASGGTISTAVQNFSASSPVMTNVTASATGGVINIGVGNIDSSPTMTGLTATATGGAESHGVENVRSSPTMAAVTLTASGGSTVSSAVTNDDSSATIRDSALSGSTFSVRHLGTSSSSVATTRLDGGVSGGGFTCVGAYDELFAPLDAACT